MEEQKIHDAEVEQMTEEIYKEEAVEKRARKISSEALMILLIGALLGIVFKTEMGKRINVADQNVYVKQAYNLDELKKAVLEKNSNPDSQTEVLQDGESCSAQ
jgi:hypothetical protein